MSKVQMIAIALIRVINARVRNKAKFNAMHGSIADVGLKKPITVSRRAGEEGEGYDLVCGQGRLEAYIAQGATEIPAIVLDIPLDERLLRSLVENLTRRRPRAGEVTRDLALLKERGHSPSEIADMVGLSEAYVSNILRLLENGEARLIAAVERGDIPISAAIEIASTDDATIQKSLQAAYDSGELRGKSLVKMRNLIEQRRARGKDLGRNGGNRKAATPKDMVRALRKEAQKQELLVKKSRHCEQQLRFVTSAFKELLKNEHFVALVRAEKLDKLPKNLFERIQK